MDPSFQGKRALVTGAGRGIGRACVKKLVECGAQVVALSRTEEHLISLKKELPGIETVSVDVSNWTATKKAVEAIGHVDLLINNAGMWTCGSFEEITEENFDKAFAVHVKGPLAISQIVARKMKERGTGGAMVTISSALSSKAQVFTALYGASKAAADHMARVMALELGSYNIRVNTVNPTLVTTEMAHAVTSSVSMTEAVKARIPLGRFCDPMDVVEVAIFLLSDKASMVHGASFMVDGGASIL